MADTLSVEGRSALMKRVRRTGTTAELSLRKALHRKGFRYIVDDRRLPGTPDLVFPRYRTAIFVHGCFWHGHDCRQGRRPTSNVEYWFPKIAANQARDAKKAAQVAALGWHVLIVWECELRAHNIDATVTSLAALIQAAPA